jgi:two-component system NarL family sensor kinase
MPRVTNGGEALGALARELVHVRETERQKVAEWLHDEFGQELVLAKLKLGQLADSLPARFGGDLGGISEILTHLIRCTRMDIHELYPQPLAERGLEAALQSLAQEIQIKHGIVCSAKVDLTPKLLNNEIQQVLFRAARELLFNVVKHAGASRVKIVVTRKPRLLAIEVSDDGQGFDPHETVLSDVSSGRFGLLSVRADLARLGGDLRLFSRVGVGTRAVISLPIDTAKENHGTANHHSG